MKPENETVRKSIKVFQLESKNHHRYSESTNNAEFI